MVERCQGTTVDGSSCGAKPRPGSPWCPWHDPAMAAKRSEWSRKGGRNRANDQRARKALTGGFKDVATAQAVLLQVLARLYKGDFDPGLANAMANVARAIDALAKTNAQVSMEQQLADLARQVAELTGKRSA